ncbi:MAG: PaaI family thioesterase [Prevotella sp.]|jgi:acyl-CoA thioesterase
MKRFKDYFTNENFVNLVGAKLIAVSDGFAKARMEIKEKHLNTYGICQGGALFTLADLAFAAAVNKDSINTLTTGANITYVKHALLGDILTAEAHELVNHHRMPFAEVRITNQAGELLAVFTASGYRKKPQPQT